MCMLIVERTLKLSHRFIVDVRKKFLQFFSSLGWMVMGMRYSWHAVYYILHISFQSWKVTIIILLLLFYSTFVIITQVALMIYPIKYNFNSLPQCKSPHSSVVRVSNHCIIYVEDRGFHSCQGLRTVKISFISHFDVCFSPSQFPTPSPCSASNLIFPVQK